MIYPNAGRLIKKRRTERGLSLAAAAASVGVTKAGLSQIESGKRLPSHELVEALSALLDLSPDAVRLAAGRLPDDVASASPDVMALVTKVARTAIEGRATDLQLSPSSEALLHLASSPLRKAKKVKSPLAGDIRVGKNTTAYRTHSYHTKVPPDAIAPLLEYYTRPGDIVLDPFCGSGMTGVAAVRSGRNAVLTDLSPAAVHIARNYVTRCDPDLLRESFRALEERVRPTMSWLYEIVGPDGTRETVEHTTWSDVYECPRCTDQWAFWDAARAADGSVRASFGCPKCKATLSKKDLSWVGESPVESAISAAGRLRHVRRTPSDQELELIGRAASAPIPYFCPDVAFDSSREMWRASHKAMGIRSVADFYTRRNLYALAALRHEILKEPDERIRNALLWAFTAIANRASKRYQWNSKRPTNVMTGTLYVSSLRYEFNVWSLFRRKCRDVIRYFDRFPASDASWAETAVRSATDLSFLPDDSIDFVFMDPPFGSNIFYSDVSLLWEAWLGHMTDGADEMVVNSHRKRLDGGKSLDDYAEMMATAFAEVRRVLKPNGYAALVFANTNGKVWDALQSALDKGGLKVVQTAALDKVHRSIKGIQADLGKQDVTRLDVILTLSARKGPSPVAKVRGGATRTSAVRKLIRRSGEAGVTTDRLFTQLVQQAMESGTPLSGLNLSTVRALAEEAGARKSDGSWFLGESKEFWDPVDSPYGCAAQSYQADIKAFLGALDLTKPPKRVAKPLEGAYAGARNSPLYNAHSYPTKIPPEAIRPFIKHFTRQGDLVLDPFSGSGMTGVAAAMEGRHAILRDISVLAAHLAHNHTRPCNPGMLQSTFDDIYSELRPKFEELYRVENGKPDGYAHYTIWSTRHECPDCRKTFPLWDAVDRSTGRIGDTITCPLCRAEIRRRALRACGSEPAWINYATPDTRRRAERTPTEQDLQHIRSFTRDTIEDWYPRVGLGPERDMYNVSALHLQNIREVADFYTPRNLTALAMLWKRVSDVSDARIRDVLRFAFTNTAWHGTRMRRFNARGGQRPLTGTLYVPQLSSEVNVLEVMRNKIRQLCSYYSAFKPTACTPAPAVTTGSATAMPEIPDESVDYVFTDPPFGSNLFYADCNVIAESWLGGLTRTDNEAVINRTLSPDKGGKTLGDYQALMTAALMEIRRVLKPKAWATVVFHNTNHEVWGALQAAAIEAGFSIRHAAGLDRKQQSHKGYKGRGDKERVAHFDVMVSMRKTERASTKQPTKADDKTVRKLVAELVTQDSRAANSTQWLHSALLRRLVKGGYDLASVDYQRVAMIRQTD